ncbi:MAG: tetratricopeptide repeat protein [Planctomycetes bacterium]|nr:tetratricopeptide repeat protein [Planctomycetota bacterium]
MFTTTHADRQNEITRILVLAVLATLLGLLLPAWIRGASGAAGTTPNKLPPAEVTAAVPLEVAPTTVEPTKNTTADEVARILAAHREGRPEDAIAGWNAVSLGYPVEVWKYVALGAAHLQRQDWPAAADALDTAARLERGNPLVHYYTGLLRLDQAVARPDWHDAVGPTTTRLAGWVPREVTPNSRSNHRLVARQELERAVARADCVDTTQPLVPDYGILPTPAPTVGDLLVALRADQFEVNAHHVLGSLYLDDGMLPEAEKHFDRAAALGALVLYGYQELGTAYAEEHRHGDAMRTFAKAIQHDPNSAPARRGLVENFGRALIEAW